MVFEFGIIMVHVSGKIDSIDILYKIFKWSLSLTLWEKWSWEISLYQRKVFNFRSNWQYQRPLSALWEDTGMNSMIHTYWKASFSHLSVISLNIGVDDNTRMYVDISSWIRCNSSAGGIWELLTRHSFCKSYMVTMNRGDHHISSLCLKQNETTRHMLCK